MRVTVEQVWINESATAGPDDDGWVKFPLSTPQTLDLVTLTNGTLSQFASELPLPPGTYHQLRLVLSDTSAGLAASAPADASSNNQVDFVATDGTAQQLPLEVLNADKGIGIAFELVVPTPSKAILAALASNGTSTNTSTGLTDSTGLTGTPAASTTCTDASGFTTPCSSPTCVSSFGSNCTTPAAPVTSTSSTTTTDGTGGVATTVATAALVFDMARDLAPFTFSGKPGFVLNPKLTGQDLARVGTIQGQIDTTAIAIDTATNLQDVQVAAELPNSDGTRHIVVLSAPVKSDGTFVLYPFPMDTDASTSYDLVFHGPLVQTTIVKGVTVVSGAPSSATTVTLGITLQLATSYTVNAATTAPVSPRGANIGFYQTLSGSGEIPYLIEERPVDPLSGLFASDQLLSGGTLAVGTFASGTSAVALTAQTPVEGAATYKIAASAPLFGEGAFGGNVAPPAAGATGPATFTATAIAVPSTATSSTVSAAITVATPGLYDKGALVVTHDGAIVSVVALDSVLSQPSSTLTVSGLPGGESGVFYAEAWVWNSSDPTRNFNRQPYSTAIDLRSVSTLSINLNID